MKSKLINETGNHYGRLTVVEFSHYDTRREAYWSCGCDCGGTIVTRGRNLRRGITQSCGCLQKEATHHRNKKTTGANHPNWNGREAKAGTICGRCKRAPMYRDDPTVDVLTCPVCGYLVYPGFLPRTGKQDEKLKQLDMKRITRELIAMGLVRPKGEVECLSPECHAMVKEGAHYCRDCKKAIEANKGREWRRAHKPAQAASMGAAA